jgi:hypothetical protein
MDRDTDTVLMALVLRRDAFGLLDELARAFATAAGMGEIRAPSVALRDAEFPHLAAEDAVLLCGGRHAPHALLAIRLPDWSILEVLWPAARPLAVSDVLSGRASEIVGQRIVRIRELSEWSTTGSEDSEAALHSPWARVERDEESGWLLTGPAQSQELHQRLFSDHFVVAWSVLELSHRYLLDDLRSAARVFPFLPLADDADQSRLTILEKTKRDSLARWRGELQRFIEHFQLDRKRSSLVARYERVAEEIGSEAAPAGTMSGPDRERELTALLCHVFDGDTAGLRRWVRLDVGDTIHRELPDGASLAELAFQVMLAIRRHGLASRQVFDTLSRARPALAARIQDVARLWGANVAR